MKSFRSTIRLVLIAGGLILSLTGAALLFRLEVERANEVNLIELTNIARDVSLYIETDSGENQTGAIPAGITRQGDNVAVIHLSTGTSENLAGGISESDVRDALAEFSKTRGNIATAALVPGELIFEYEVVRPVVVEGQVAQVIVVNRVLPLDRALGAPALQVFLALVLEMSLLFLVIERVSNRHSSELTSLAARVRQAREGLDRGGDLRDGDSEIGGLLRGIEHLREVYEEELRKAEDSYSLADAVLGQVRDGIIALDKHGTVTLMNGRAAELFQTGDRDVRGVSLAQVVFSHRVVELWRKSIEDGERQSAEIASREGNRTLLISVHPFTLALGEFAILVAQDVTRQRELETMRRDFVSNITHELRTPIASIKALTETLQSGALDDKKAAGRFLDRIDVEVESLHQMVAELLDLSRIESGREQFNFQQGRPCDLGGIVVARMQAQAERAGLTLEFDCHTNDLLLLDLARIEQVLVNLIHNAIKFTPPGGRIELSIRAHASGVEFTVSDTGVGIPKADIPRIFERFYKGDRSRSDGGTGLGLAISRHIVEGHGGEIWVESEEGRGAAFSFLLPRPEKGGSD